MAADNDIERKMREIQERIGRLESSQRELERSLEDIDHRRRRMSDRIERAGGNDREAEAERSRLLATRDENRRDHESNDQRLEQLRSEAAALQQRIDELRRR